MKNEQESLLEFPCRFPVKAMGRNTEDFESMVTEIVLRHAPLFPGERIETNSSSKGNFLSVTVTVEAQSREQIDSIYLDLTDCEQVLMAL